MQKRALNFVMNNYESTYKDLLNKIGKPNMNLRRTISFCIEIYKTLNTLNPKFMKNLFRHRATKGIQREVYKFELEIPKFNQLTFDARSLRIQDPKVWNSLLHHIRVAEKLEAFSKEL